MKKNLETQIIRWFNDSIDFCLNYSCCSEWLSTYVSNSDQAFLLDFFEYEEIQEENVETLRVAALKWIREFSDEIVNFDDYR